MITDRQRERRKKYLGSSDSPAVCGVDPWRNAYDVYLSKIDDAQSDNATPQMEWGNVLEPALIQWACERLGLKARRNVSRVYQDGIFAANADAILPGGAIIEAKTAGLSNRVDPGEWGEDDSDEVPERVLVQCHHLMIVHKTSLAYVPALLGGRGLAMFRVERNDDLANQIYERGVAFWTEHVKQRVPPPNMMPSLETLQRMQRVPGKAVPVPVELIEDLARARQAKRAAEAQEEAAKAAVLLAMGDAERGDGVEFLPKDDPCYLLGCDALENRLSTDLFVTAKLQTRTSVSGKELKRLAPDLYQQIAKVSEHRVVRIGGSADAED